MCVLSSFSVFNDVGAALTLKAITVAAGGSFTFFACITCFSRTVLETWCLAFGLNPVLNETEEEKIDCKLQEYSVSTCVVFLMQYDCSLIAWNNSLSVRQAACFQAVNSVSPMVLLFREMKLPALFSFRLNFWPILEHASLGIVQRRVKIHPFNDISDVFLFHSPSLNTAI